MNNKGLENNVSYEFGHSKTFIIIEIEGNNIKNIGVIQNPAKNLNHDRGSIVAKYLANMKVNMVISGEIGPGASIILDQLKIEKVIVKPGQKVIDVLKEKALIK
ncbi:MAG: NifB/NifX family molybdenum-iron cluster-binding protein [Nitrososphaerota archaeon]